MIENLRKFFPSLLTKEEADDSQLAEYTWFQTESNESFGIPSELLSTKEGQLLQTLLPPLNADRPPLTEEEQEWSDLLFHGKASKNLAEETRYPFRLLFFSFTDTAIDPLSFREAIHGFFPDPVPVLWENTVEGIIIESQQNENDPAFYYDIAEVLMSDFYIKLNLAIGQPIHDIDEAQQEYRWLKQWAEIAKQHSKSQVIDYREAAPYLFLSQTDGETSDRIIDMILKETQQDPELLKTIEVFLESNSNATLAAKKLYMHRNSLQYRVEKFIEQTGIDVKQFEGALSVYLTLGLLKKR